MKFKDFQAPVLFSTTFKALNLGKKNSSTFKDAWEPYTDVKKHFHWFLDPTWSKLENRMLSRTKSHFSTLNSHYKTTRPLI